MLASGLRIGEASAVTWAALDLDAGTVEVRGTVIRLTGKALVLMLTTKSTAGMRALALPSWCVQMLPAVADAERIHGPQDRVDRGSNRAGTVRLTGPAGMQLNLWRP